MKFNAILLACLMILPALVRADAPAYSATYAYSLQGKLGEDDGYGQADKSHFEAGDCLTLVGTGWTAARTLTVKGVAIFDLQKDGLGDALKKSDGREITLSFVLDAVQGQPRPLRVEYVGTANEVDSERALRAQFEREPLHRADRVLDQHAKSGLKVVDVTSLFGGSFSDRYLVIRFEQEGDRRELHSPNDTAISGDLYVFRQDVKSVRLTIQDKRDTAAIANQYGSDGYPNLLPDQPQNLTPELESNPITDQNLTPITGMQENILTDMPKGSLFNDGQATDAMP